MSNHRFWRKENGAAAFHTRRHRSIPKSDKRTVVESSKVLEEVCAEHYGKQPDCQSDATSVSPRQRGFFIDEKERTILERPSAIPNSAKLVGNRRAEDLVVTSGFKRAPERSSLRVAIAEFDKLVERTVVDDCVRI